jgi:hypothetical protein
MSDRGLIALCLTVLLVMAIVGGALATSGLAIGLLTSAAFLVLAVKSRLVRSFARAWPLLADLLATALAYLIFPGGVTAFVGSGVVALCVTVLIALDRIGWVTQSVPK